MGICESGGRGVVAGSGIGIGNRDMAGSGVQDGLFTMTENRM